MSSDLRFFQIQVPYLPGCQMALHFWSHCLIYIHMFVLLFTHGVDRSVTHALLCYVSCFTPQCTSSGPSSDLLHIYCSVTLVVLHLSAYPVNLDLLHIYCSVTLVILHLTAHPVDPVQICYTFRVSSLLLFPIFPTFSYF